MILQQSFNLIFLLTDVTVYEKGKEFNTLFICVHQRIVPLKFQQLSQEDGVMSRINTSVVYVQLKCLTQRQCNGNKETASQANPNTQMHSNTCVHRCPRSWVFVCPQCGRGECSGVTFHQPYCLPLCVYLIQVTQLHQNKHITAVTLFG